MITFWAKLKEEGEQDMTDHSNQHQSVLPQCHTGADA